MRSRTMHPNAYVTGVLFQMMRLSQTIYQGCIEIFLYHLLNTMLWIYFYYVEVIILQWKRLHI